MQTEKEINYRMSVEDILEGLLPFKPIAYYDKHLDAIRVQILDCSIWEERLDRIMTVYHANHHLNPNGIDDIVGFSIKGVRYLLRELGIKTDEGPIQLANLLDEVAKRYPAKSTKLIVEFYRNLSFSDKPNQEITINLLDECMAA